MNLSASNNSLFIHAGWNKTGSTFLQQNIFIPIFGKGLMGSNVTINRLQTNYNENQPLLISDESLLGVTIFKRHICRNAQRLNFLKNWAKIAPNTQFILCVRKHDQLIESLYRQYLHVGGTLKPEHFIDIAQDDGFIKIQELLYEPILENLIQMFPGQHFIYDYDDFKVNPDTTLRKMLDFMNLNDINLENIITQKKSSINNNASVGYKSGIALRTINKFVSSSLSPNSIIPQGLFKLLAFGKTPRQIFQVYLKDRSSQQFTEKVYNQISDKLELDWKTIKADYTQKIID